MDARLRVAKLILEDLSRHKPRLEKHGANLFHTGPRQSQIDKLIDNLEEDSSGKEDTSDVEAADAADPLSPDDVTMKLLLPAEQFDAVVDNEWSQSDSTMEDIN